MKIVAILSTTILPVDGVYRVDTITREELPPLEGVLHYVGHPTTAQLIEELGAIKAPSNLFLGLQPGECALAFAITQGKSSRVTEGVTHANQETDWSNITIRLITRADICPFCKVAAHFWACSSCGAI